MAKKIEISKIGNSTVVKQWESSKPSEAVTKNYNQPYDVDLIGDNFLISKDGSPVLSFLFSQIENPGEATTPEEYLELMATSFFFSKISGSGGTGSADRIINSQPVYCTKLLTGVYQTTIFCTEEDNILWELSGNTHSYEDTYVHDASPKEENQNRIDCIYLKSDGTIGYLEGQVNEGIDNAPAYPTPPSGTLPYSFILLIGSEINVEYPDGKIRVERNPFELVKNPMNTTNIIKKGDMAVNGYRNNTTFIKAMVFNSGDPTLFESWIVLDQIEEIET